MDTLLYNGQHQYNNQGSPVMVGGVQELMQRAMIRLIVPRGSFPDDPGFGSRLRSIPAAGSAALRNSQALAFVREALLPIREIAVQGVQCAFQPDSQRMHIRLLLTTAGESSKVEVRI